MVVMYFVGLPSNSDKNEKLPMSSFVEGLRLLSKMKKYRYFWTSKLQKTSETSDGSHSRKNRQSLKSTLVLTVSKTRITTRSQGTKKTESSTSFTVELQLLDDYVGQIVTILMINAS